MIQTSKIIKKIEGKNAVITGESSGIGPATAQRFVKECRSMSSPVVLITGALTGIGRATAVAFAREEPASLFPAVMSRKAKNSRMNYANLAQKWNSSEPTFEMTMISGHSLTRPSHALVDWMLLSTVLEPKAHPDR